MNSVETSPDSCELLDVVKKALQDYPVGREFDELIAPVEKQLRKEIWKRDCIKLFKLAALFMVTSSVLITYTPIYYHLRAIGRLTLIQLTPYWNWIDYYDRDCLVANVESSFYPPDCAACEDVGNIETVTNITSRFLIDHYINQQVPVIVADGALDWSIFNDPDFSFNEIGQAYNEDNSGSRICNWRSNILPSSIELDEFFQQVSIYPRDRPWFAHWENCGRKSIKTGRRFYPRPYFITPAVDLSFTNWILVSNRYKAQRFKKVKLHSTLALVAQIRGFNRLRLLPDQTCQSDCPAIQFTLLEGEIALLNTKQWNLEYQPGEDSLNIAFIIQGETD